MDALTSAFPVGRDPHGWGNAINLALWSPAVLRKPTFVRFALDPAKCDGHTFRHHRIKKAEGLMMLYLRGVFEQVITPSNFFHTSSISAERGRTPRG